MDKAMENTISWLTSYKRSLECCELDFLRKEIVMLANHPDWGMRQLSTWAKGILAKRTM